MPAIKNNLTSFFKRLYSLITVMCLLLSVPVAAQNSVYDIMPVNGNTSFNYNQVPENLVSQVPGLTGLTYIWESSTLGPINGFAPIAGTAETYTFPAILTQTTFYRRKATGTQGTFTSNVIKIEIVSTNWENLNYVRQHDVLVAGQTDWKTIDQLAIGSKLQTTTYMDGLGRPIQKVSRETALQDPAQPNNLWGDMVQFSAFDVLGRQNKKYLPYTTINQSGKYKTATATDQPAYYTSKYAETAPFSQVSTYDNSPLNRALKLNDPGTNWTGSAGNQVLYDLNDATDNVQIFTIGYNTGDVPVSQGAYPVNTLFKTKYTDEKGKLVIDYTDKNGYLILKKVQLDDAPADVYNGWICTYSVYDDFGQLRFRMQPEAVKWLVANAWNFAAVNGATVAAEWCFRYEYDEKGRTLLKKAPGAKELLMLYDGRDRVVFMQDGNQRGITPTPQWTANLYDELDRPVLTTLYTTAKTTIQLQADIDNSVTITNTTITNAGGVLRDLTVNNRVPSVTLYTAQNSIEFVSDAGGSFQSTANDNFVAQIDPGAVSAATVVATATYKNPITSADLTNNAITTILKYFFYDNYSFARATAFSTAFDNAQAYAISDPIAATQRTLNMPTGTMVRVLNTTTFLSSTFYYDEKGRPIQASEENVKNGIDVTTSQYQFDGRLLSAATRHTIPGSGYTNYAIITKNIFDKIGRVNSIQKKFGANAFKTIASYDFDDMGRLKTKHLDPGYTNTTTGKAEMESLAYTYNIHNQITGINKDYALKTAGPYSKWGNYFGLALGFDKTEGVFAGTLLNGQVNGLAWNTQGDDVQRKFDFTYDNAGRLTNAAYNERQNTTDAWSNAKMDFSTSGYTGKITYDLNGNLLSMLQKGVVPGNSTPFIVDDLRYSYANNNISNRLTKVTDQGTTLGTNNGKLGDFADGANGTGDDYVYDDNGNLIIDLNKNATSVTGGVTTAIGASGIRYNFLDKPEEINIPGKGNIKIVYDADGNKLQKLFTKTAATTITVTSYLNEFIYEETTSLTGGGGTPALQYINFEEGRLRVMQAVAQNNGFDYLTIDGNADMANANKGAWDFFVRDYQGNVRMILTEEAHTGSNSCTMETARAANEEPVFGQVDVNGIPTAANEVKARFAITGIPGQTSGGGWTNNTSGYVSRVGNLAGKKVGPNVLMKVMAGDEISATSMYYYQNAVINTCGGASLLSDLLASLVNAISGSSSTSSLLKANAAAISTQLTGNVPFSTINEPDYTYTGGTNPKAYMTMVFFDERFNVIPENSIAKRVQTAGPNATNLNTPNQKAPKNGYCMVYVSNESDEMVYFDNLQVTNKHARIIEENHYYAYGLKIAAISSKKMPDLAEGRITNKDLYNDKELVDDADLNWYDYGFRSYDPQIGRFPQLDPLTDDYPELTPFQYASCDPIDNIDIDGLEGGLSTVGGIWNGSFLQAAKSGGSLLGLGVNISINIAKIGSHAWADQVISKALAAGAPEMAPALGGAGLFTFLILSPDFDTWGQYRQEFPQSHWDNLKAILDKPLPLPVPLPKFKPAPNPPKNSPPKDDGDKHIQYRLIATENEEYPKLERGDSRDFFRKGIIKNKGHLNVGDTWKIGTTSKVRYSKVWLKKHHLRQQDEYRGTKEEVELVELIKIFIHELRYGEKPFGNTKYQ